MAQGPSIGTRRTKLELFRHAVHQWPKSRQKQIAKELIWLAKITLQDLEQAQREIVNLRQVERTRLGGA